jgi:glycosyltransferase involved in cell wall biosynthesis
VMAEAMACGTPVIAYRRGSVPEIIEEGVTGFIVHDLEGAVRAAEHIPTLDRWRCRQRFEERFSAARMARDYLASYQRLVEGGLETKAAVIPDASEAIPLAARAGRPRGAGAVVVP